MPSLTNHAEPSPARLPDTGIVALLRVRLHVPPAPGGGGGIAGRAALLVELPYDELLNRGRCPPHGHWLAVLAMILTGAG